MRHEHVSSLAFVVHLLYSIPMTSDLFHDNNDNDDDVNHTEIQWKSVRLRLPRPGNDLDADHCFIAHHVM